MIFYEWKKKLFWHWKHMFCICSSFSVWWVRLCKSGTYFLNETHGTKYDEITRKCYWKAGDLSWILWHAILCTTETCLRQHIHNHTNCKLFKRIFRFLFIFRILLWKVILCIAKLWVSQKIATWDAMKIASHWIDSLHWPFAHKWPFDQFLFPISNLKCAWGLNINWIPVS